MSTLTLAQVLKDHIPTASAGFLFTLETAIRDFFGEKMGYNLQWRTRLIEVVDPQDKDKPKDQQRILFRFEVRAGDFISPDIEITDLSVKYHTKGTPEATPERQGIRPA